MRVAAYVLAGDPTWLATSVSAYYPFIERLVVSYDRSGRGWTGAPIAVDRCLSVLRAIDADSKIIWVPGDYGMSQTGTSSFLEAETFQRNRALEVAGESADWVLQIDSDEVLPRWSALQEVLKAADANGFHAVEWPMRVLYRKLGERYLQVVAADGRSHYEYPGAVAVRSGVRLVDARTSPGRFLRPVPFDDGGSLQLSRPEAEGERRIALPEAGSAICHNSWARPRRVIRAKLASWAHNQGAKSWIYYYGTWLPAPVRWRTLRNFHPLHPPLWPKLAEAPAMPFRLHPADVDI